MALIMLRLPILIILLITSMTANASLHPRWKESGWLTDFNTAQAKSRKTGLPVFIYFDAIWCSWCQVYKRKTLDKPEIQRKLTTDYIPVVIDYDARPQLFNQLGGRGLPFNIIMNSDGKVLNRFVGLLSVTDLQALLNKFDKPTKSEVADQPDIFEPLTVESLDAKAYQEFRDAFLQHIESLYSTQHKTLAGFYESGITLKRPSPLTWVWLLQQPKWKDRAVLAAEVEAERLWDTVDGGFFQYLQRTPPLTDYLETSKLLEVNARLAQWMVHAGKDAKKLSTVARNAIDYLFTHLRDTNTRAFFQSQIADQHYYQLPIQQRKTQPAPGIDKVIRMDTNAQTILALLDIANVLQDEKIRQAASEAFQFLLSGMIKNRQRYHLYSQSQLQHPAELADEAWLLAAGLELQRLVPDKRRKRDLLLLIQDFRRRIDYLVANPPDDAIEQDTLGIVAWIAVNPLLVQLDKTLPGDKYVKWALGQIRLGSDTPPDSLIFSLRAWDRLLNTGKTIAR